MIIHPNYPYESIDEIFMELQNSQPYPCNVLKNKPGDKIYLNINYVRFS